MKNQKEEVSANRIRWKLQSVRVEFCTSIKSEFLHFQNGLEILHDSFKRVEFLAKASMPFSGFVLIV